MYILLWQRGGVVPLPMDFSCRSCRATATHGSWPSQKGPTGLAIAVSFVIHSARGMDSVASFWPRFLDATRPRALGLVALTPGGGRVDSLPSTGATYHTPY